MSLVINHDKDEVTVSGTEYVSSKLKTKTVFVPNDVIINATNTVAVFAIPSLPANSYAEISGVILFKFASGANNIIGFTLNPTSGIGSTDVGFTVHKGVTGGELMEINLGAVLSQSTNNIDSGIHAARFSGVLHNPGGSPINNFQLIAKNANDIGQGVALTILSRTFMTYQVL